MTASNDEKFKAGDHVWSFHFGVGIVTRVYTDNLPYPVVVKWVGGANNITLRNFDYFTKNGEYDSTGANPDMDIMPLEVIDLSDLPEDSGVVDRMMDALDKKTDDAINPSHYQVEGIPEAIEIMQGLMTKEQFEGFLWGNILKYAYRYGRKGDKKDTAGKIKWYAEKLEEVLGN